MSAGTALFRDSLGAVLRAERLDRAMTLRELSAQARVSPGYISEVERGQKEASSELLGALCRALEVPLSVVLHQVSKDVAATESEGAAIPRLPSSVDLDRDVVASAA